MIGHQQVSYHTTPLLGLVEKSDLKQDLITQTDRIGFVDFLSLRQFMNK